MNDLKIFFLTHGTLCNAFKALLEYLGADLSVIRPESVPLNENESADDYRKRLLSISSGCTPLFITDIPGGTPDNCAKRVITEIGKGYSISGINVPMIAELIRFDSFKSPEELTEALIRSGKNGIREFYLQDR